MTQLRLKEFRKKARMTQSDVANILNITQAQYSRLEIGKSLPNSNQIIKLCKIFKCTPNDIFGVRGALEAAFGHFFNDQD